MTEWIGIPLAADEVGSILDLLDKGGVLALLVLLLVGFWREWFVTGAAFRRLEAERDMYRDRAFKQLELASQAITLAQSQVEKKE